MKKEILPDHQKRLNAIGSYLRELRFSEGLTQKEIKCGVHRNILSRIENPKSSKNFTILTLFHLCDYYGIKPSELLNIL